MRRRARLTASSAALTATVVWTSLAQAQAQAPSPVPSPAASEAPEKRRENLDPRRFELAGFPIVGGNSDIGIQFGGAATLTRFFDDVHPYLWNIDLLLSASVKNDQGSLNLVQQSHVLRLDAPDLFNHRMRLDARGSFERTINEGYYGIGNAAGADPRSGDTATGRLNQYVQEEARLRTIMRFHTRSAFDLAVGTNFRFESSGAYAGSKLANDALRKNPDGTPYILGTQDEGLAGLTAGIIVDTRDNEFITTRGFYYQLGFGGTVATAEHIRYGTAGAVLAHYAPLGGPFVFASRIVADFQFGNVPFYDLQQGGPYEPQYLLGSETGVRGVPVGR
ncbi:MAG TPA: BamA/TamA family outer membrane protein, partial [Polyangiaceae bacterium]